MFYVFISFFVMFSFCLFVLFIGFMFFSSFYTFFLLFSIIFPYKMQVVILAATDVWAWYLNPGLGPSPFGALGQYPRTPCPSPQRALAELHATAGALPAAGAMAAATASHWS